MRLSTHLKFLREINGQPLLINREFSVTMNIFREIVYFREITYFIHWPLTKFCNNLDFCL